MSCLERMLVHGIRSFGGGESDGQVINFYPLTLILGPNGAGKTTLIECLRYMCTGEMPPNSNKGSSFIHDPKISGECEVKGQIKLKFRDVHDKKTVVTRSLLATQKQKNVSIRTLDSVIKRVGPDGQPICITSKCADIDREMVASLGVSKAVLTNVIFCHQEDSNWPLSEGKVLKEKFDEIFDASRYIKALEIIKKMRLDKKKTSDLLDRDLNYLRQNKVKATQIQNELKATEKRLESATAKIQEIEEKLVPHQRELDEINEKEGRIYQLEMQISQIKTILTEQQKKRDELERTIVNLFNGNKEQLEQKIQNFKDDLLNKERTLKTLKQRCETNEQSIKRAEVRKFNIQKEISRFEAIEEQHKMTIKDRNDKVRSLVNMLKLPTELSQVVGDEEHAKINTAIESVQEEVKKVEDDEKEAKEKYTKESEEFQSRIDALKIERSKIEQSILMNQASVREHEAEILKLKEKINRVASSSSMLYELDTNIVCLEGELQSSVNMTDVNALTDDINLLKASKSLLEKEISDLSKQLDIVQKDNSVNTELALQEKEKILREEKIQKIIRRHSDTLQQLLGDVPSQSLQEKINGFIIQCEKEINRLRSEQSKQRSKLTTLQTSRDMESRQLKIKEENLNRFQDQIMKACGTQDFTECLEKLQSTISELQNDKGALIGSRFLFTKYMKKVQEEDCCPLCHRNFQEKSESEELVSELKQQLDILPCKLERQEKVLDEKQRALHDLLELKPILRNVEQLYKEIPDLREKLTSQSEEINCIQAEISEIEKELDSKQWNHKSAQSVQRDSILYDQAQSEIKQLDLKIATLKSKLSQNAPSKPIDVLRNEITVKQNELKCVDEKIENNQKNINRFYSETQKLKEQINKFKEEKLKLSTEIQQQASFEERLSKITNEKGNLELTVQNAQRDLSQKKNIIENLEREKKDMLKVKEREVQIICERLSLLKEKLKVVINLTEKIESHLKEGKTDDLCRSHDEMNNIDTTLKMLCKTRDTMSSECDKLQQEIGNHQLKERELQDNLLLMECNKEIVSLEEQLKTLEEIRGNVSAKTFVKRKKEIQELIHKLNKEQQQIEGRHQEVKLQVEKLKFELKDDMYRDAHKKYMECFIDFHTTRLAVDDLAKYYRALDHAVMSYHGKKMKEINEIIHDLWASAYNGTDIDYIEIRSDDQHISLDKRRNYSYRVVMVKGDVALDMRGRCSAGQKVLASLIIRLALAEAFCINCGVFALDEPTTNLDSHHIDNLAESLKEIINNRSVQKNFQLLIITHDKEFIYRLSTGHSVEYIQMVEKDENNLSKITKARIADTL